MSSDLPTYDSEGRILYNPDGTWCLDCDCGVGNGWVVIGVNDAPTSPIKIMWDGNVTYDASNCFPGVTPDPSVQLATGESTVGTLPALPPQYNEEYAFPSRETMEGAWSNSIYNYRWRMVEDFIVRVEAGNWHVRVLSRVTMERENILVPGTWNAVPQNFVPWQDFVPTQPFSAPGNIRYGVYGDGPPRQHYDSLGLYTTGNFYDTHADVTNTLNNVRVVAA